MARDFQEWLSQFRPSIANYGYYIDFDKVWENVSQIRVELNILNSLIARRTSRTTLRALQPVIPKS